MAYYDMHTHILPGIDDGAKDLARSLEMIRCHLKNGITNIALTPHFYTNQESIEDFAEKREAAFRLLKKNLPENVQVCLGAEVYVTSYLFNNPDLSMLCYGKSKYILTEFPYQMSYDDRFTDMLFKIQNNYGLIPVIPHIERFPNLFNDLQALEELVRSGVKIQTNVSSFKGFTQKRKILKRIDRGLIHILGTDAHSMERGSPDLYLPACAWIAEKLGKHKVQEMQDNAAEIFNVS